MRVFLNFILSEHLVERDFDLYFSDIQAKILMTWFITFRQTIYNRIGIHFLKNFRILTLRK